MSSKKGIKRYKVDYDFKAEVVIEINHNVMTEKNLAEINNFWSNSKSRAQREGSVLNAVLKMLAATVLRLQVEHGYNTGGIIDLFNWNDRNGQEGWPEMDGSHGIKLVSVDEFSFEYGEMSISELDLKVLK